MQPFLSYDKIREINGSQNYRIKVSTLGNASFFAFLPIPFTGEERMSGAKSRVCSAVAPSRLHSLPRLLLPATFLLLLGQNMKEVLFRRDFTN